jgi:rhamnulokinase
MDSEIRAASGLGPAADRDAVVRCVLDSLGAAVGWVTRELAAFVGGDITRVDILGGGSQNELLVSAIANATGAEIHVGPAEATAIGNALVQATALA